MNTKFTYHNFYEILELSDTKLQEIKLKEFIDNYEFNDFFNHDRRWFNTIVQHGLVNLIYYCEKTIPYFSLYDKHNPVDHFSNISFLWAIESGDVDTLNYFFNHPDFYLFCRRDNLETEIANFLYHYKERNKNFTFKNYEKIIDLLVQKFPFSIPEILEKNILKNKNDESSEFILSFINKYKIYLYEYLFDLHPETSEDNFTRFFMVSLNHNNLYFADNFKKMYPDYHLIEELASFYLCNSHELHTLNFLIDNPNHLHLTKKNFINIFDIIFKNPLNNIIKKEEYQFFFTVVKHNFYDITKNNFEYAIIKNFTPFVKKYYKIFKDDNFEYLNCFDNTCTRFIDKQVKEKNYHNLLKKLPEKGTSGKKMKI